jgi:hypothetical protein
LGVLTVASIGQTFYLAIIVIAITYFVTEKGGQKSFSV